MSGHECTPGRVEWKFDDGRGAILCPTCRVIVGYLPVVPGLRPERVVKAEALREAARYIKASQYGAPLPVPQVLGILRGLAASHMAGDL